MGYLPLQRLDKYGDCPNYDGVTDDYLERKMDGPSFLRYCEPIITALKKLGNSGKPGEIRRIIIEDLNLPAKIMKDRLSSGESRFVNQVHWARFYLKKTGYLYSERPGVWALTLKGIKSKVGEREVYDIYKEVMRQSVEIRKQRSKTSDLSKSPD